MAKTKKEIDKETMYKKLMPSGPRAAKIAAPAAPAPVSAGKPEAQPETPARQPSVPTLHRPAQPRKVSVPFMDNQRTVVVNAMEAAVLEKLDTVLARCQCCRCDRCKKDIVALALNKLPPKYMVLSDGQSVPDADAQTNAAIITAMIQAVIKVRSSPRH